MEKFCQSCGMPMNAKGDDMRGTEKDAGLSNSFCRLCYQGGAFVEPNITLDQMRQKGLEGIEKGEGHPIGKWLMKKFYPMQLKNLQRWKS